MLKILSHRKQIYSLLLIASLALLNLGVWAGIFTLTEQQEIQLGVEAAQQTEQTMPILNDKKTQNYIVALGEELVSHSSRNYLDYHFQVVNISDINAFALPGGFIYIHRGLIEQAETENELAGVLAHEIAHVTERHSVEQVARARKTQLGLGALNVLLSLGRVRGGSLIMNGASLTANGVFLKHSRDAEREADRVGAQMMYQAGWDPRGMITFFSRLPSGSRSLPFLSTHPDPAERQHNIADLIQHWSDEDLYVDSREFQGIKAHLAELPEAPTLEQWQQQTQARSGSQ